MSPLASGSPDYDHTHRDLADRIANSYDQDEMSCAATRDLVRIEDDLVRRVVHALLDDQGVARVLDVGSGTGRFEMLFARYPGVTITGLDFSPEMIRRARDAAPGASFVRGPAEKLPFKSEFFDLVVMGFGVPCYSDKTRALPEAYRVLKRGGYLVATVYNATGLNIVGRPNGHGTPSVAAQIDPAAGTLRVGNQFSIRCKPVCKADFTADLVSHGFDILDLTNEIALRLALTSRDLGSFSERLGGTTDPFLLADLMNRLDKAFCERTGLGMYTICICRKVSEVAHGQSAIVRFTDGVAAAAKSA